MSEAMSIALIGAIVSLGTAIIPKMMDNHYGMGKDIKDIKKDVSQLKKDTTMNSDMIYQTLSHLSTNNNTGGMAEALNRYNEYFRHTTN